MTAIHGEHRPAMNAELLLPAAFMAGFFGGTHCIGMCGAIVVLFEQQPLADSGHWLRRFVYNGGRLGFLCRPGCRGRRRRRRVDESCRRQHWPPDSAAAGRRPRHRDWTEPAVQLDGHPLPRAGGGSGLEATFATREARICRCLPCPGRSAPVSCGAHCPAGWSTRRSPWRQPQVTAAAGAITMLAFWLGTLAVARCWPARPWSGSTDGARIGCFAASPA